ncbi:MAG: hypothetical protein QNK89_04485 [Lacinutrix sp.]|uniref:hypothetical protein n=1 Tax=Lacinutrix sp. TaxID=1937692 RepID=UPI0030AE1665
METYEILEQKVMDYYNFRLTDNWSSDVNYFIYEESTADGYSVFVASVEPNRVSINEDVYYYDSDLKDALVEYLRYTDREEEDLIYIDDFDAYFLKEAIQELNEDMLRDIRNFKKLEND